jgi:hypothetical protein
LRPNSLRQSNSIRAQLANVYLMQPCSDASIEALYSLGLNYTGCFEPHTLGSGKLLDPALADGDLEPKSSHIAATLSKTVLVWCHPKAVDEDGSFARNIAAYIDGPRSPPMPDAILNCDTFSGLCAAEAFSLDGGGSTVVLTMQMPDEMAMPAGASRAASNESELASLPTIEEITSPVNLLPYPIVDLYVSQGLALMLQLIRARVGAPCVPDAERCRSVAMAATLFEQSPHVRLPSLCVKLINQLIETKSGVATSISPSLNAALNYFVFNFELWAKGTDAAQLAHAELVVLVVRRNKLFIRDEFGFNHFLRALQLHKTDSELDRCLRAKLLQVLDIFAEQEFGPDDTEAVLSFIRKSPEAVVATDVAEWMRTSLQAWLMHTQGQPSEAPTTEAMRATGRVFEVALTANGPPFELYAYAARSCASVRASILWTIAGLCSSSKLLGDLGRARLRLEDVGFAGIIAMFSAADNTKEVIEAMVAIGTCPNASNSAPESPPIGQTGSTSPISENPDVITSHPEFLASGGGGGGGGTVSNHSSPVRPMPLKLGSVSVSRSGTLPKRKSQRSVRKEAKAARLKSSTDGFLDTRTTIGKAGIRRRVVCPAALEAALRLVSDGNEVVGATGSVGAGGGAAAGEVAGTYAFELIECALQAAESAHRFSEVVSWEQAILLALHSTTIRAVPPALKVPVFVAGKLTSATLREQHHPRFSAVISMLHTVIWEKFLVESTYLSERLPKTFECIDAELSAILYSIEQENEVAAAEVAAVGGGSRDGSETPTVAMDRKDAFPSSTELKMWLLTLLLESLSVKWTSIVFAESEMTAISAYVCKLSEELLYSDEDRQHAEASKSIWSFRTVLSLVTLRFSRSCGTEFELRGPEPLESDSAPQNGALEFNLRIVSDTLLSMKEMPGSEATARMVQYVADWLLRFRLEPKAEETMTADRALYIIWHLAAAIKARGALEDRTTHAASLAVLVGVVRKFLKSWWWCLSASATWGEEAVSEFEPLSGPTDPRLKEDSDPEVIETMINSPWWAELTKRKLRPAKEKVVDADYLLVLPTRNSILQSVVSRTGSDDPAAATRAVADSSGRSFVQGTVLTRVSKADKNYAQSEQRDLSARAQAMEAAALHLQAWDRALFRPLGVFGPPAAADGPFGSVGAVPGHWKVDRTEDFSRIRRKLAPVYGTFNVHDDAADARDNNRGARRGELPEREVEDPKANEQHLGQDGPVVLPLITTARSVQLMSTISGVVEVTTNSISFLAHARNEQGNQLFNRPDFELPLVNLREMHARRYNLRHTALEFFSVSGTNHLINFGSTVLRDKVFRCIKEQDTPSLIYAGLRNGATLLAKSGLIKRWQQRKISNFEYLMQLNTLAGRTYNDLNQYPVFPWVLADYSSEVLDLSAPATFRDLSKPAGAMNEERCEMLTSMYEGNDDPVMGRFHYGTHYSNAAYVLHYLLRIEPFTSLHIDLQSGKFDHSDRQFVSFYETWKNIESGSSDVKELIPEMFYLPEALQNISKFNLGELQNGTRIDEVVLPPWAGGNAHEFIRLHRAALESEHVSLHLHQWIDLIFGHKQTGSAAEEAVNCFLRSSYEGNVDLDSYEDPRERHAMEDMIRELGQTPSQLLTSAHPARKPLTTQEVEPVWKLKKAYFVELAKDDPVTAVLLPSRTQGGVAEWMKSGLAMKLITMSEQGLTAVHDWLPNTASGRGSSSRPFTFDVDPAVRQLERGRSGSGMVEVGRRRNARQVALAQDNATVLMAGCWDGTVKLLRIATSNSARVVVTQNSSVAPSVTTCLALDDDGETVVVGCQDGSAVVYRLCKTVDGRRGAANQSTPLSPGTDGASAPSTPGAPPKSTGRTHYTLEGPTHIFYGHSEEVMQVLVNTEADMVLTCSRDGTVNMHTITQPKYIRTLRPEPPRVEGIDRSELSADAIEMVRATGEVIATYGTWRANGRKRFHALHAYNINGQLLATDSNCGSLVELVVTPSGHHFIAAKRKGSISVRNAHNLETIYTMSTNQISIRSMSISSNESHLFIALQDGKLIIVPSE